MAVINQCVAGSGKFVHRVLFYVNVNLMVNNFCCWYVDFAFKFVGK